MNTVYVLFGPTSSGKTALALQLAQKLGCDIISADSRQIYKFMDVGTGKRPISNTIPLQKLDDKWLLDDVTVWGYDLTTPDKFFSAYDFAEFAHNKLSKLLPVTGKILLVGGTGFYVDIVTGRIKPSNVVPDLGLRTQLEELSLEELQQKLHRLNPELSDRIDSKNPARLMRAIEIELNTAINKKPLSYLINTRYVYIGLTAPREFIYARADLWVDTIWKNGLIAEVGNLIKLGYKDSPKMHGLVYKTALAYLQKELSEQEAIQRIKFDVHSYIRRQQTYFKKMIQELETSKETVKLLDISKDDCADLIYNLING